VLTSFLIFPVAGFDTLLTMTLLFFPGLHSHLTYPLRFLLMGLHQGSFVHDPYATRLTTDATNVEAVAAFNRQTLQSVWHELDCRIDICRLTERGHIENL